MTVPVPMYALKSQAASIFAVKGTLSLWTRNSAMHLERPWEEAAGRVRGPEGRWEREMPSLLNLSNAHSWLACWIHPLKWPATELSEELEVEPSPDHILVSKWNSCFKPVSFEMLSFEAMNNQKKHLLNIWHCIGCQGCTWIDHGVMQVWLPGLFYFISILLYWSKNTWPEMYSLNSF